MHRRNFFELLGAVAVIGGCTEKQRTTAAGQLVGTPEKRERYLGSLLNEISALGPRPCGSPAYLRGAEIIRREMARSLPRVEFDRFSFERWTLLGEPELYVDGTRLETYPGHGTSGTPPEGIEGVLVKIDEGKLKYGVADKGTGQMLAYISSGYEKAVPLPYYFFDKPVKSLPTFNIGDVDMPFIEKAAAERKPVRLSAQVEFIPDTETMNVVGTLPGDSPEEILFIAHLDTVYNTVGANDNTASVIVMVIIAHALSGMKHKKTVTFLATEGEEYNKIGAVNYAERRRREKTFGHIRYLVNFDSLTWGQDLQISSRDEGLRNLIGSIDRELDIPGTPNLKDGDGFALDGRPFRDDSIRAMYVNSTGFGNDVVWHRPDDTPENVPADCAEIGFLVFSEYARCLMEI